MNGKGRVFFIAMGDRPENWQNAFFLNLLAGGIRWSLGEPKPTFPKICSSPRPATLTFLQISVRRQSKSTRREISRVFSRSRQLCQLTSWIFSCAQLPELRARKKNQIALRQAAPRCLAPV